MELERGGSDYFNDPPSQNTKLSSAELPNMKEGLLPPGHKILIPSKWKLGLPSATECSSGSRKTQGGQGVGPITDLDVLWLSSYLRGSEGHRWNQENPWGTEPWVRYKIGRESPEKENQGWLSWHKRSRFWPELFCDLNLVTMLAFGQVSWIKYLKGTEECNNKWLLSG